MKVLYWMAAMAFVVIASILGCFIVPYISWAVNFEFYIAVLVVGIMLLLVSVILLLKNKDVSKILLPIALCMVICGGITTIRLGDYFFRTDKYILSGRNVYSNLGIHLVKGVSSDWIIAYDEYQNKVLVNFSEEEEIVGEKKVWNRDADGDIEENENGQRLYSICDLKEVSYKIYVYDENGYFNEKIEGDYRYTYCEHSNYDYEYEYSGVYTEKFESSNWDKTEKEIKAHLRKKGYDIID